MIFKDHFMRRPTGKKPVFLKVTIELKKSFKNLGLKKQGQINNKKYVYNRYFLLYTIYFFCKNYLPIKAIGTYRLYFSELLMSMLLTKSLLVFLLFIDSMVCVLIYPLSRINSRSRFP